MARRSESELGSALRRRTPSSHFPAHLPVRTKALLARIAFRESHRASTLGTRKFAVSPHRFHMPGGSFSSATKFTIRIHGFMRKTRSQRGNLRDVDQNFRGPVWRPHLSRGLFRDLP